jgi:hypothetical protein
VAIKVIASYTEDQIITSDPSQILAIKKAKMDLETAKEAEQGTAMPGAVAAQAARVQATAVNFNAAQATASTASQK